MGETRLPLVTALGLTVVWVTVAAVTGGSTTFHLAPTLVAAAPLLTGTRPTGLAAGSILLAATATAGLWAAGLLDGPSLLPRGGALLESAVGVAVGAALVAGAILRARGRTVAPATVSG